VPWHVPPGLSTSSTIDATSSSASSYWTSRDRSSVDVLPLICSGRFMLAENGEYRQHGNATRQRR
jgi:hypothetical protein